MAKNVRSVRKPTFQIVSSVREPTYQYYVNQANLEKGLLNDEISVQGNVVKHSPTSFVLRRKSRISKFTRSANAKVRDNMARALRNWLPELPEKRCLEAFDCLFDLHYYKEYLTQVGHQKRESMNMLIFVRQRYVAHVQFSSVAKRKGRFTYTVNATLTCQRYTYFELLKKDLDTVIRALQNLDLDQ